jgi:REase_DpnII-MboI
MQEVSIESTVASVQALISKAVGSLRSLSRFDYEGNEDCWASASIVSSLNSAYMQLLILTEALELTRTYDQIRKSYDEAVAHKDGIGEAGTDPDGEPYLMAEFELRRFVTSIEAVYGLKSSHVVSKDVIEVLRATLYAITDRNCFLEPPSSEADVHHRVEAVLRCIFPDLRHAPPIPKSVKNFEPDTGLPSIRTLVEYKFIQVKTDVGRIADEILADTRGYKSSEWDKFIFLIYETQRFKPEKEWNSLLQECDTAFNTQAIVICGESPKPKAPSKIKK